MTYELSMQDKNTALLKGKVRLSFPEIISSNQ